MVDWYLKVDGDWRIERASLAGLQCDLQAEGIPGLVLVLTPTSVRTTPLLLPFLRMKIWTWLSRSLICIALRRQFLGSSFCPAMVFFDEALNLVLAGVSIAENG